MCFVVTIGDCTYLYSGDMSDGQTFDSLPMKNTFLGAE
jgi:hypothetical protein